MSDNQRYRSGAVEEVKGLVKAGVLAEVGDLVCQTGTAPTVVETYTSFAGSPTTFRAIFLGVLVQGATRGTETTNTPCLVYTAGEFEFPLTPTAVAAVPVGNLVAAAADQQVTCVAATTIATAIGRLAKAIAIGDTTCLVRIDSVAFGGPQGVVIT